MCWVIRLENKFLTVAGQRRIYTDFPQSHFSSIPILSCRRILLANRGDSNSPRALQAARDRVIVRIWNIDALAVLECMSQRLLMETGLPMVPK